MSEFFQKHKKLICILVPVLIIVIIVIVAMLSGKDAPGAIREANIDKRNATKVTGVAVSDKSVDTNKELNGHYLVAANDGYELYLKKENLSIIVRDIVTGSIMESTVLDDDDSVNAAWAGFLKSGVNVEMQISNTTQQRKVDLLASGAQIDVKLIPGGFTASIDYTQYELGFDVTVILYDDGSIEVTIPESSIYENSETNKIGNIYLFPMLGNTKLGEMGGYMLVPDGNGALIYLDDKEGKYSAAYTQKVYGTDIGITEPYVLSLFWKRYETVNDPEYILAPVYGMVHEDSKMAYLGVITSGAEGATIEAYPNGAYTNYNWITAKFLKTTIYNEPTSNSGGSVVKITDRLNYDISIRFFFTRNEEANYAGLAGRYRDYLLDTGKLVPKEDSFKLRADFFGSDRENWMFTTKATPMTTTDDIREIYEDLRSEGVTDLFTLYKGWQEGGINNVPVDSYDADSSLGGTRDLTKLMDEAAESGISFYLYVDALRANPSTTNTTFNVIKKIDTRLYSEDTYKDVYATMHYLTPVRTNELVNNLVTDLAKKDIKKLALTGITNTMFTFRYSGTIYDRFYTAGMQASLLENIAGRTDLVLEEPIETYWKYTNAVLDMPVKDSDYIFTDESVPFLSIVFKGILPMYSDYVNFEANKHEFFLKLVETGIYPSFYLTMEDPTDLYYTNSNDLYSSKYAIYRDTMIEYYKVLKQFNEQVAGAMIDTHTIAEDGTVTVTYSNGAVVTIDYNHYSFTVVKGGSTVMDYKAGDAE